MDEERRQNFRINRLNVVNKVVVKLFGGTSSVKDVKLYFSIGFSHEEKTVEVHVSVKLQH